MDLSSLSNAQSERKVQIYFGQNEAILTQEIVTKRQQHYHNITAIEANVSFSNIKLLSLDDCNMKSSRSIFYTYSFNDVTYDLHRNRLEFRVPILKLNIFDDVKYIM